MAFHQLQVSSLFPPLPQFICVKESNLKMLGTNIFMVFISFTEEVFYFVFSILVEVYFYFFTCFSKSYLHYSDAFFSKYAIMKKISLTRIHFLWCTFYFFILSFYVIHFETWNRSEKACNSLRRGYIWCSIRYSQAFCKKPDNFFWTVV